ncbi:MAG: PAS domain-containing protein [Brevinematia bacterium]
MKYFFQAPSVNGLLVFEDNEYLGVVLKKDIELGIATGVFNLYENINFLKVNEMANIIFKENNKKNSKLPVIDKTGALIKFISYEEFQSHFYFDEFIEGFKIANVFDNIDYPFLITNYFKKCIYANKKAFEIAGFDIVGKSISILLKKFEIKRVENGLILERNGEAYNLMIHHSETRNFTYLVYNFFTIGRKS